MKHLNKWGAQNEIQKKVEELNDHFEEEKGPEEVSSEWYCGVTGQPTSNDKFELERIGQHYGDKFPELIPDSICKVKVSSVDVAMKVEKRMKDEHDFDIGEMQNEPTKENQIWVYIFRKEVE